MHERPDSPASLASVDNCSVQDSLCRVYDDKALRNAALTYQTEPLFRIGNITQSSQCSIIPEESRLGYYLNGNLLSKHWGWIDLPNDTNELAEQSNFFNDSATARLTKPSSSVLKTVRKRLQSDKTSDEDVTDHVIYYSLLEKSWEARSQSLYELASGHSLLLENMRRVCTNYFSDILTTGNVRVWKRPSGNTYKNVIKKDGISE